MKILSNLGKTARNPSNFLQKIVEEYVVLNPESKELTLKSKTVLLLCERAISRVEQLVGLEPHVDEGLLATVEHQNIKVKVHFTPEKILLKDNLLEGQLRLLSKPDFETSSLIYRALISGWKSFLGGYIPNQALPDGVRLERDRVYYEFPKQQSLLIDSLFKSLENGSTLELSLNKGELQLESTASINWNDIKFQELLHIFKTSPPDQHL